MGCTQHVRQPWSPTQPVERRSGRWLQGERERLFREYEYRCATCGNVRLPRDLIRDHKVPLTEGGLDVPENTQPLCRACNEEKTKMESKRGRDRSR